MKVSFITNKKAPYRSLQFKHFAEKKKYNFELAYVDKNFIARDWKIEPAKEFDEIYLNGSLKFLKHIKIILSTDIIILGGYYKPIYIYYSLICKFLNKKYILLFDGISPEKIYKKENLFKYFLKKIVIGNSSYILGNGSVSKEYFIHKFKYPEDKIYNQVLTVDIEAIQQKKIQADELKKKLKEKYQVNIENKIVIYSGRLVERKNIKIVIDALSKLQKEKITFIILGDGIEKQNIINYAKEKKVDIIITGFIKEQSELFEHYFLGDLFILPSYDEPWGLVVNEAMAAGLPVIVSTECGSGKDLIKEGENGFTFSPNNADDLSNKIKIILKDKKKYGESSLEIIKKWNFNNSYLNFNEVLEKCEGSKK